ncbi:MAG: oligosaccharide flippase family protein [Bacteroidia bacterium]|nr:oligosaccharide flippase family protein [Bacteroidia bacterium]
MVEKNGKNLWERLMASEAGGHILTVFSGTFVAQVFSFLILPFLAILYTPEDMGVRGVFLAVHATIAIALNGGYEVAIMLPEQDEKANELLLLSLFLTFAVSTISLGLAIIFGDWFWSLVNTPELLQWQYLLVMSLLFEGLNQPLRIYVNRFKHYRLLTASKMAQPMIGGIAMLGFGYMGWGFEGLILGGLIGQVSATILLVVDGLSVLNKYPFRYTLSSIKEVALTYQDFPKKGMGSAWLNVLATQLPMYILPATFGKEVAGHFHLAQKALMMPFAMVAKAVGDVFYEQASRAKAKSQEALKSLTHETFRYLAIGGLVPSVLIMLFAPAAISLFPDPDWHAAGEYIRWLMPWVYATLLAIPLSFIMDVERRLDFQLWYQMGSFLVKALALGIGAIYLNALGEIVLYSLSCTILSSYLVWEMLKMSKGRQGV